MPTFPEDSRLIRFGGAMGTMETWSCGIRALPQALGGDSGEVLDDVAAAVEAWFKRADSQVNGACTLDFVTVTSINSDGKQIEDETPRKEFDPPVPAPISAGPYQLAYCITFRTAKPRGRAASGRIYVPTPGTGVSKDGLWFADSVTQALGSAVTLLNDLTGNGAGLTPYVISGVDGTANEITRVEVGNVLDTQRRRRRSLVETYQGTNL